MRLTQIIPYLTFFIISACTSSTTTVVLPTLAQLPTIAPTVTNPPTMNATSALSTATPTATPSSTPSRVPSALPTATGTPQPSATVLPTNTHTPLPQAFAFGQSAQGRNLEAFRYGTGSKIIMLVGGIHTGFEANTTRLVEQLRAHFADHRNHVLPGITMILIPVLNPDGLLMGRQLQGRFNSNNVDLNRNWGCGWSPEAVFRTGPVDPGSEPFSEPETRALGSLIQRINPATVLFFHSAADGVFAGNCGDTGSSLSDEMVAIYGEATGYPYGASFTSYAVTGTAPAWVDSMGIPSADVELASATATEFERNLNGVMALQRWLLGQ